MPIFPTRDSSTPLWNQNGGAHGASPFAGPQINVTGQPVNLPNGRGWAYRLVDPSNAFVLIADLVTAPTPEPEPDPEPTITLKHVIKVYSDGSLIIDGQPYP